LAILVAGHLTFQDEKDSAQVFGLWCLFVTAKGKNQL
jgi:hypothetical protein